MTQAYYRKTPQQALEAQNASAEGLSAQEARRRAEQYGPNKLSEGKKKSTLQVFLEQFKDLMVLILIIAAVISAFSGNVESTIVIFAVLVLNAILGTVQYEKAEKSLESLKAMASPTAKVMRGGVRVEIPSADVVPGDIVLLEAGDMVVADGRVLENFSLKVNESSLTGESEGVDKTAEAIDADQVALGDQKNMVFSGSLVTYGRATVADVVERTAEQVFVPLTVGGGIRTLEDFRQLLRAGADKISVNSAAVKDPGLISRAAERFGSQCVVLAIDARRRPEGSYEVVVAGGRTPTGLDAVEWARRGEALGAGEILLTSMDADGTKAGFDLEMTRAVTQAVSIPVIASGGCGSLEHFAQVFAETDCDAALAASLFHFGELTVPQVKEYLRKRKIPVR